MDEEGDIVMQDAPTPEPVQSSFRPPRRPTPGTIVQVPIKRNRKRSHIQEFIPYDNPAVMDVQPLQWHRKMQGIYMFRYTDFQGWPAVQPTGKEKRIRAYFEPLLEHDSEERYCDEVMLEARWWCCWVQGFTNLEPELR